MGPLIAAHISLPASALKAAAPPKCLKICSAHTGVHFILKSQRCDDQSSISTCSSSSRGIVCINPSRTPATEHPNKLKIHLQEYISNVLMWCLFHYDSTELYLWIFNLGEKKTWVFCCVFTPLNPFLLCLFIPVFISGLSLCSAT